MPRGLSTSGVGDLGIMLLGFPVLLGVCVGLGFFLQLDVLPAVFPLTMAAQMFVAWHRFGVGLRVLGAFASTVVLGAVLGSFFLDPSYDGNAYHRSAALCLVDGWNPTWGETCGRAWTDDYPMLAWVYAAAQSFWTGSTESGMAINLVAVFGAGLSISYLAQQLGLRKAVAAALGLCVALNPVAMTQLWSSYVDGLTGSYLSVGIFSAAALGARRVATTDTSAHLFLVVSLVALINFKFTGALFACVVFCGAGAVVFLRSKSGGPAILAVVRRVVRIYLGGAVASLLIGFSPYVRNLIQGEHLFHPVLGDNAASFVDGLMPACLEGTSRLERPFRAMLFDTEAWSRTCVPGEPLRSDYSPGSLFSEFGNLEVGAWRLSGFGPFMPLYIIMALVALVAFCLALVRRRSCSLLLPVAVITGLSLLTTFLVEPNWWARYVPQLWLVACLPVVLVGAVRSRLQIPTVFALTASLTLSGGLSLLSASQLSLQTRGLAQEVSELYARTPLAIRQPASSFAPGHDERQARFGWPTIAYVDAAEAGCGSVVVRFHPNWIYMLPSISDPERTSLSSLIDRTDLQLFVVAVDDAVEGLSERQRSSFRNRGVPIDDLAFRGSLAAAMRPDRVQYVINNEGPASLASAVFLGRSERPVVLSSAGYTFGNAGDITVGGVSMVEAGRGLNVIAFDQEGRFMASLTYDTYRGESMPTCP